MKRILVIVLFISAFSQTASCQFEPVDVADLTIKVKGISTKELYYGFAEGDQIIFNFEDVKGKPMKEIEIIELPSNSKYMDYKSTSISDKTIKVNKKSVYKFVFKNSAMGGRICKVKIQRVPKTEDLISFNTNWEWKTLYDTTYVPYTEDSIVGYDTTYTPYTKKELLKVDTSFVQLFNKTERVHSATAIGKSQYSYINVYLPQNTYLPDKINPYETSEVISWTYWLGVGKEAQEAYIEGHKKISSLLAKAAGATYGPLGYLAVTGVSVVLIPTVGDNVSYWFITSVNGQQYTLDSGNGIAATGRNTKVTQGGFTIKLYNDNFRTGIDVMVRVLVVKINKTYQDVKYERQNIIARKVTLNKKRMVVKTTKIRINGG